MTSEGLLEGRAALVTGAAQGIGLAIARAFSAAGAHVVLADIDGAAAERSASDVPNAIGFACDVTDESQVDATVQAAVDAFGSLDVMVNNAGFTRDKTMRNLSLDDFKSVLDVHVVGAWLGTRAAGAVMREQRSGLDREHLLPVGEAGQPWADQLQRRQGRNRGPHQGGGQGAGAPRGPGERGAARI